MLSINNELFTRLLLIRHGQTIHNTQLLISGINDIPLTEKGHQEAQLLADRVKSQYKVAALYTSPLQRTVQTAEYLSRALNIPAIPNQDLIEYNFGILEGIKTSSLRQTNPELFRKIDEWCESDFSDCPIRPEVPGSESLESLKKRIRSFSEMILEKHPGEVVAAVSHGGFIKSCLYYHTGGDFSRYIPYWVDNVSISIIDFYKGNPVIRLFNDNSHIKEDLVLGSPRWL